MSVLRSDYAKTRLDRIGVAAPVKAMAGLTGQVWQQLLPTLKLSLAGLATDR